MQDTESANPNLVFGVRLRQQDLRSTSREIHLGFMGIAIIRQWSNSVIPSFPADSVQLFVCTSSCGGFLSRRRNIGCFGCDFNECHDSINQSVNNFKARRWTSVSSGQFADVASTDNGVRDDIFSVQDHSVTDFKQLETIGERCGFVVLKGFEQSRKQGCTANFIFDVGRIRQRNSPIFSHRTLQSSEVIVNTAQTVGQNFRVSCSADFFSQQIADLVERFGSSDRVGHGNPLDNVVVPIGNSNIFGNIDGMKNVRSSRWNSNLEKSVVFQQTRRSELYLVAQSLNFGRGEIDTNQRVAKVDLSLFPTQRQLGRDVRVNDASRVVVVFDLHGYDGKGRRTVLAEHCEDRIQDDVCLGQIGSSTFDEDIFRIQCDL
mmetsp:Transcript_15793/g.36375  ORF Transcript_15793/g.36375 Transcript_15793/m.36375 type:complete len:375 (-) Transcript_15793:845-1969(-)